MSSSQQTQNASSSVQLPQYTEVEVLQEAYSSEEELSPVSWIFRSMSDCVSEYYL